MSYFDTLTLNGVTRSGEELVLFVEAQLGSGKTTEYEKSLYSFIKEWVSPGEVISVKTSGTTGEPKMVSFQKMQAVASAKMTCEYFDLINITRGLLCLSPEYIAGKMMIVRAFVSRMNLITVEPVNNPLKKLKIKIDFAAFVPMQVQHILEDEESAIKFQSIGNVIIGGASIPFALEEKLAGSANHIYATFSMSETLSHVALRRINGNNKSDVYVGLPGVRFSTDKRGCLIVDVKEVSGQPVVTNDIVELIDSTRFRWIGRHDNVINSGGVKIHPEIVENKIASLINPNRFFIASLPDEKLGQKVVFVIEGDERFDIANVQRKLEGMLQKYEIPKEYYRVDTFLETATGKVKKEDTLKIAIKI